MFFSYYEVYTTSLRAFTGMGFPYGADEDAAYMTTWLELHKLGGVQKLAELSNKIDQQFNGKIDLDDVKSKEFINLYHTSLLMKGPSLLDYLYEETKKNQYLEVVLENCIDPVFIIPLAKKISKNLESIKAGWLNDKNKKIGINVTKNKMFIGEIENNIKILEGQILLQFSMNDKNIPSGNKKLNINKIQHEINDAVEQGHLKESLNPNSLHWDIISKLAKRTFVPASNESRIKGAGGGNDND